MKRIITLLLTICVLFSSVVTIGAIEILYIEIETANNDNQGNELQPMLAITRSACDYPSFHALLDAKKISYTGEACHTQLQGGYSYTYAKNCDNWAIYLTGPDGTGDLYYVGSMN